MIGTTKIFRLHLHDLAINKDPRPCVLDWEPHDSLLAHQDHAAVALDNLLALRAAFPTIRKTKRLEVWELSAIKPLQREARL